MVAPKTKKPDSKIATAKRAAPPRAKAKKAATHAPTGRAAAARAPKSKRIATGAEAPKPPQLVFREVTSATWSDFAKLFDGKGAPGYCYCMVWRATAEEKKDATRAGRKAAMKKRVRAKTRVGILGYVDGEPKAWCSIAPRDTFVESMVEAREGDDDERVWSLTCFFVHRDLRRQGVMTTLVRAAKKHAKKHGATILEAYPVAADSPSYRFGGFLPVFQDDGFVKVGKSGSRRHVVRHRLVR